MRLCISHQIWHFRQGCFLLIIIVRPCKFYVNLWTFLWQICTNLYFTAGQVCSNMLKMSRLGLLPMRHLPAASTCMRTLHEQTLSTTAQSNQVTPNTNLRYTSRPVCAFGKGQGHQGIFSLLNGTLWLWGNFILLLDVVQAPRQWPGRGNGTV